MWNRNRISNPTLITSVLMFMVISWVCGQKNGIQDYAGLQLYSLRNQFEENIPETMGIIKAWGVKIVEGGERTYGMDEAKFISLLKKNGLQTVSAGTSFEELRDNPGETLRRAKAFGAKYAMCPWIPHKDDDFTFADTKNATEIFNTAGKFLKDNGINLVYHPHGYEFRNYEDGTFFDYMAKNAQYFDFEMDVYWVVHGGENPMVLFERYPNKFKLMHLKDMKNGTVGNNTGHGDVEDNVVLGTGMIPIEELIRKGKELGIEYMFVEDESSRVLDQVPKSLKFIQSVLK